MGRRRPARPPLHRPHARPHPRQAAASSDERWAQIARLLHDDTIELTDRVAGALLLLYGQQLSRIAAITLDQVKTVGPQVFLRFGRDDLHIPEPLAGLLQTLIRDGRPYVGVGSPATTRWLFPGLQPGRPLTAARLGDRLRKLGIRAQPGRRAALTHLAAQLPAAVLADLLGIAPHHRRQLGPRRRRRLEPLRRPTRPNPRSPTMTNALRHQLSGQVTRRVGTLPVTSLDAGGTIDEVQQLLGHASISSSQIYLHPAPQRLRDAVERVGQSGQVARSAPGRLVR